MSDHDTATSAANQGVTDNQRADTAGQSPAEQAAPSIEALTQSLQEWQAKADSYLNDLLRTRAEAENVRKRAQRDVENAHKYGQERLVSEMLPVKDSMELGLSASEAAPDVASIREGLALTLKMFNTALEKIGVKEVNPVGEKFNPELHQAMTMQEADAEPGSVLTVVQKGYQLNDRLVRPAMVIVAKARN